VEYWKWHVTEAFWAPPKPVVVYDVDFWKFHLSIATESFDVPAVLDQLRSDTFEMLEVPTIDNSYWQCVTSTKQSERLEWLQKERSKHGSMKFRGRKGEITSIQGLAVDERSPGQSGQALLIARLSS